MTSSPDRFPTPPEFRFWQGPTRTPSDRRYPAKAVPEGEQDWDILANHYAEGELFCREWVVCRTPWFGIILRKLVCDDLGLPLHNHTVDLLSFILRGGYSEIRSDRPGVVHRRRMNFVPAETVHQIVRLDRRPTWTLSMFMKWRGHVPFVERAHL
jgi:hypothetical protein